jgi:hypothetical protein
MPGSARSRAGVSSSTPASPSRSTARPSAISRRMAAATTSRGASLIRVPVRCGSQAMPVGWNPSAVAP